MRRKQNRGKSCWRRRSVKGKNKWRKKKTGETYRSKVSTIVKVFILESKEIPDETPEYFERTQNGNHDFSLNIAPLNETHRQCPTKSQHKILHYGKIVEPLEKKGYAMPTRHPEAFTKPQKKFVKLMISYRWRIHNFFPQKSVISSFGIKQSPIHFDIPSIRIARWNYRSHNPKIKPRIVGWVRVSICKKNGDCFSFFNLFEKISSNSLLMPFPWKCFHPQDPQILIFYREKLSTKKRTTSCGVDG